MPGLDDAAVAHDADAVGHRQRLLLVMGDQHEGDADIALQVLQLDLHVAAQLAVESGERLVEQQHLRPVDQGAGKRDALLLAAGEFPDCAAAQVRSGGPARAWLATLLPDLIRDPAAALRWLRP